MNRLPPTEGEGMIEGKKPKWLAVIAWTWIITGAYMALSGLMSMASSSFVSQIPFMFGVPEQAGPGFGLMMNIVRHFALFAAVQVLMGAFVTAAGVAFLKLRPWGRTAVEALSWVSLVGVAASFVFGIFVWSAMTRQIPQDEASLSMGNMGQFRIAAFLIGLVVTLACAIPFGVMIKYLRGEVVRDAVQKGD